MRRVFPAVLSEPFQDGGELCRPFLDLACSVDFCLEGRCFRGVVKT